MSLRFASTVAFVTSKIIITKANSEREIAGLTPLFIAFSKFVYCFSGAPTSSAIISNKGFDRSRVSLILFHPHFGIRHLVTYKI